MANANKLSASLKALLKAPHARGNPVPSLGELRSQKLFGAIEQAAKESKVADSVWLTLSSAALVTLNSPATLCDLYHFSTSPNTEAQDWKAAAEKVAIMREAGLKSISFSGIPRAINGLGALRSQVQPEVAELLRQTSVRKLTPENVEEIVGPRSIGLWESIYQPHSDKLLHRLSESHPDLPVHILHSHYGPLLSDPSPPLFEGQGKLGRVLTSVVAISCLRAQQGVELQVASHIFGLKKSAQSGEERVEGEDFLQTDEGSEWVLTQVDRIVETLAGGKSPFASVL